MKPYGGSHSGFICTPHAANRYAQRVMGIDHPTHRDVCAAAGDVNYAATKASVTYRYRDKTRVMVTEEGVHLIVKRGGIVVTVLAPGQPVHHCRCEHCVRGRQHKNKKGGHG